MTPYLRQARTPAFARSVTASGLKVFIMGVSYQLEGESKENLAPENICAGFLLVWWGGWRGVVMVEAARAGAAVAGLAGAVAAVDSSLSSQPAAASLDWAAPAPPAHWHPAAHGVTSHQCPQPAVREVSRGGARTRSMWHQDQYRIQQQQSEWSLQPDH